MTPEDTLDEVVKRLTGGSTWYDADRKCYFCGQTEVPYGLHWVLHTQSPANFMEALHYLYTHNTHEKK